MWQNNNNIIIITHSLLPWLLLPSTKSVYLLFSKKVNLLGVIHSWRVKWCRGSKNISEIYVAIYSAIADLEPVVVSKWNACLSLMIYDDCLIASFFRLYSKTGNLVVVWMTASCVWTELMFRFHSRVLHSLETFFLHINLKGIRDWSWYS